MFKYVIEVEGMKCGMCESHVNNIVRKAANVVSVKSSHNKGETVIKSKEKLSVDKITKAIAEMGYVIGNVSEESWQNRRNWLCGFNCLK